MRYNNIKKMIILTIIAIIALGIILTVEPFVLRSINRIRVIQIFLVYYISWHTIKMFFVGIILAPISLIIANYFLSPLLSYEIILEKKLLNLKLVKVTDNIMLDIESVLVYSYILFGPLTIVIRILSILPTEDLIYFYLVSWELFMENAPYIFLFLLVPFWLREMCRIRELKSKFRMTYPSKLLGLIAIILIGVGSITALVPLFLEILNIFKNFWISIELFIGAVLLGYLPMLSLVLGWLLNLRITNDDLVNSPVRKLEKIIENKVDISIISIM